MHKAEFLDYRPSQLASTAMLVAIDLNKGQDQLKLIESLAEKDMAA